MARRSRLLTAFACSCALFGSACVDPGSERAMLDLGGVGDDGATGGGTEAEGDEDGEPNPEDDSGDGTGGGPDPDEGDTSDGTDGDEGQPPDGNELDPPAGESSGGSGGGRVDAELLEAPSGVFYRLIAPGNDGPLPFLLVYSGTEGSQPMSINLLNFRGATGTEGFVMAVLHGVEYYGDTQAGIDVIEEVRRNYDIDNDRTYLMSESAGTVTGLELGLRLRQSYFAAYWANDVNASATPALTADELGFAPFGNSGPGGQFQAANAIVSGMQAAGYRTPGPAPYDGPGSGSHGDLDQLVAAISWFPGKTRQ